jgi:hypothetical protein
VGVICQCIKPEGENILAKINPTTRTPSHLVLPIADVIKLVPQAKEEMKKAAASDKKAGEGKKKPADSKKKPAEKKPAAAEEKADKAE